MEEEVVKKVGMIACIMGIVMLMFISCQFVNLSELFGLERAMDESFHFANITEDMREEWGNGGAVPLTLEQLSQLLGMVQVYTTMSNIVLFGLTMWGLSLFFGLGLFIIKLGELPNKKRIATYLLVENIIMLFPTILSFTGCSIKVGFAAFGAIGFAGLVALFALVEIIVVMASVAREKRA